MSNEGLESKLSTPALNRDPSISSSEVTSTSIKQRGQTLALLLANLLFPPLTSWYAARRKARKFEEEIYVGAKNGSLIGFFLGAVAVVALVLVGLYAPKFLGAFKILSLAYLLTFSIAIPWLFSIIGKGMGFIYGTKQTAMTIVDPEKKNIFLPAVAFALTGDTFKKTFYDYFYSNVSPVEKLCLDAMNKANLLGKSCRANLDAMCININSVYNDLPWDINDLPWDIRSSNADYFNLLHPTYFEFNQTNFGSVFNVPTEGMHRGLRGIKDHLAEAIGFLKKHNLLTKENVQSLLQEPYLSSDVAALKFVKICHSKHLLPNLKEELKNANMGDLINHSLIQGDNLELFTIVNIINKLKALNLLEPNKEDLQNRQGRENLNIVLKYLGQESGKATPVQTSALEVLEALSALKQQIPTENTQKHFYLLFQYQKDGYSVAKMLLKLKKMDRDLAPQGQLFTPQNIALVYKNWPHVNVMIEAFNKIHQHDHRAFFPSKIPEDPTSEEIGEHEKEIGKIKEKIEKILGNVGYAERILSMDFNSSRKIRATLDRYGLVGARSFERPSIGDILSEVFTSPVPPSPSPYSKGGQEAQELRHGIVRPTLPGETNPLHFFRENKGHTTAIFNKIASFLPSTAPEKQDEKGSSSQPTTGKE